MRFLAILLAGAALALPARSDVLIAQHASASFPEGEGWTKLGPGVGVILDADSDAGTAIWEVEDTSTESGSWIEYHVDMTPQEHTLASINGWQLRVNLRVVDVPDQVDASVSVSYDAPTTRYDLVFGTDGDGDPIVQLAEGPGVGPSFTVEGGAGGYYLYELIYDPLVGSADLFVNGVEQISDWAGFSEVTFDGVKFGSRSAETTGHGNYQYVEFSIFEDIGGYTVGVDADWAICQNTISGQSVMVPLPGANTTWDCEEFGLEAESGDLIRMIVEGAANPVFAAVGGYAAGIDADWAGCLNMNTGQRVAISLAGPARSWGCVTEGLVVTPGDVIRMLVQGPAD